MISRVADHCFWLGRYIERAESMARLLFVTDNLALDAGLPPAQVWPPVVIVAGERDAFPKRHGPEAWTDGVQVLEDLTWSRDCAVSVVRSIGAARDNARAIRETISLEVWQTVNELHNWVNSAAARAEWEESRYHVLRQVIRDLTRAAGELRSTMLRGPAYDFIWLGQQLERAAQTARVLDVYYHYARHADGADAAADAVLLGALLRACTASEPYMKRHQGRVVLEDVTRFLLYAPDLPRSVQFALARAHERLTAIRPSDDLPGGESLGRLQALIAWLDAADALRDAPATHAALTRVVDETAAICVTLSRELLGYGPSANQPEETQ